ncbi:ATP-binding protein [Tenacibaculum sp. 190524A02b]|uniref:histidine kinase n=1 Tax=Tenacibaculum vairaonense TaxID=3137860 RepID=A0ABP1F888_9FLAO
MTNDRIKILERALHRATEARKQAEEILEQKSLELYEINQKLIANNTTIEALLNEQSSQLKLIVDNSSLGIVLTQKHQLIKVNKAFIQLLGYTEEELIQMTIKDISHEDNHEESSKLITQLHSGKIDNFALKKKYKKKDGNIIVCRVNVSAVRNTNGSVKYQIALIEDVTQMEHKTSLLNALNQLSISILGKRDLHEIAWEIAKNTANHLNLEDCVVYAMNNETNMLTPIAAYANIPIENFNIIDLKSIPYGKGVIGNAAKTGKYQLVNDTTKNKMYIVDGYRRLSELTVPIIANNKVIGIIDSEHSKKGYFTEEHVEVFNNIASLASAQFNSAISLINEKKALQEKNVLLHQLEKNNEELKNFAHVVSHDLKSPLRSISALLSWIQEDNDGKFDEDTLTNFNALFNKIDRMDQLINGILKYSSIDKVNKGYQKVDINKLVNEIIDTIFIPENFIVEIKNPLPIIYGDKFKFHQLFQNLISNAIKYTHKEKGIVTVDVEEHKSHYTFSIKDNGIGIDKKYHSKIFEVFETLEDPNENSTGIGLSIVKKIIDLYDGKIWLESEKGKGTTFFFKLKKKPR